MHDTFVDALDLFQVGVEYLKKLRRDGLPVTCERHAGHAASDLIEAVRIGCQRMRLTVIFNLQSMFKITKEDVTVDQTPVLGVGEQIFIVKAFEREQCSAVANPGFVRTMQSLHALHEKFDVPNTSSGKLYIDLILAKPLARELFADTLTGGGHGLDSCEVETGRVNRRFQEIE